MHFVVKFSGFQCYMAVRPAQSLSACTRVTFTVYRCVLLEYRSSYTHLVSELSSCIGRRGNYLISRPIRRIFYAKL